MNPNTVLILSHHAPMLIPRLQRLGLNPLVQITSEPEQLEINFEETIGIITSNTCFLPAERIALFPNLQFIGRLGSGMEIIDVAYAEQKKIVCFGSAEGNAQAVAEHALGMLLALLNRIGTAHQEMKQGFFIRKENTGREISSLKVGIVGFGANGSRFAEILSYLGAQVFAHDIRDIALPCDSMISFSKKIDEIVAKCDVLSFHVPINNETKQKAATLMDSMQNPYILINCARGELVPVERLLQGLKNEEITGACIDVWEREPLSMLDTQKMAVANEILGMPQVVATPHIAGYSHQATEKMSAIIADKIEEFLRK